MRKLPSLHGQKSTPLPKSLGTFVCQVGTNFQIFFRFLPSLGFHSLWLKPLFVETVFLFEVGIKKTIAQVFWFLYHIWSYYIWPVDNTPKRITFLLCQWKKWKTYRAKCTILCLNFILCCYFANYAFKLFPSKVCYISSMTFLWDNWQTETKARLITPRKLMSMKTRTSVCLGKLTYPRTTI